MATTLDMTLTALVLALGVEAYAGYPAWLTSRIGHPVVWVGGYISCADHYANRKRGSKHWRQFAGVLTLISLLAIAVTVGLLTEHLVTQLPPAVAIIVLAFIGSSLLAQHSLAVHVNAVATAIDQDGLEAGRHAVSHIVGRDVNTLDQSEVCRATIESLAENFSDAVVAPTFWWALGGLPGLFGYKSVNTADSMIGHKTTRHRAFGWAAARCDDWLNLPASRLAALYITAAGIGERAPAARVWRTIRRDARGHRSPNAGYPEAAMAGVLDIRLAGPRSYDGEIHAERWIGNGRIKLTSDDIRDALRLYWRACLIHGVCLALIAAAITVPRFW